MNMAFQKLLAFTKKVADFADKPSGTPAEIKAQFDAAPDEVRQSLNNLIDGLKSTTAGDSGAFNIGTTAIQGLTGANVQAILESLNTLKANKAQSAWSTLATQNGWQSTDLALYEMQLFKDEFGVVHFHGGRLKNGITTGGTVIAIIPEGMRPEKNIIWKEGNHIFEIRGSTGNLHGYGLDAADTVVGVRTWRAKQ